MSHPVIDLNLVLKGDQAAISQLRDEFSKRGGWCLVSIPESLREATDTVVEPLLGFFGGISSEKWKCRGPNGLGHSSTKHKEALRWLTGSEFNTELLPPSMHPSLTILSQEFEKVMLELAASLKGLFKELPSSSLPLLKGEGEPLRFSLVDVAYYYNNNEEGKEQPALNCAEHWDPGLLSLSTFTSLEGFEFYDASSDSWVAGPAPNQTQVGALWVGDIASRLSHAEFKPAKHRVQYSPSGKPRMSMWTELCTVDQILGHGNMEWGKVDQIIVPNMSPFSFAEPYKVKVKKEGLLATLQFIEQLHGLPMAKIMKVPVYNDEGEVVDIGY